MEATQALTPEVLVPRLGEYLVEKQFVSLEDLEEALAYQESLRSENAKPPLIGQILVRLGKIDQVRLDKTITEQILQLRQALEETNQQLETKVAARTEDLQQALQRLSELNQEKVNFVSNISHELRTPLTHLRGYLDLLVNKDLGDLEEKQLQALNVMQRATDKLEHLINDLILFSTSENEVMYLNIQPFDIKALCLKVINSLKASAIAEGLSLEFINSSNLPYAEADQQKIEWTIYHLLENAIKFTPPGGKVILRAEQNANLIHVNVMDTGIGIPEDKLDEIFEPFHQLDGSSTRKYAGVGLGLSLVKKMIEAHGSVLHVQSVVGEGSSFEFLLNTSKRLDA
jgi:signal transduction histidine kinase